jgi:hypothetical protein
MMFRPLVKLIIIFYSFSIFFKRSEDDDVFFLLLQKQKIAAKFHIPSGRYGILTIRGPSTNDMKE